MDNQTFKTGDTPDPIGVPSLASALAPNIEISTRTSTIDPATLSLSSLSHDPNDSTSLYPLHRQPEKHSTRNDASYWRAFGFDIIPLGIDLGVTSDAFAYLVEHPEVAVGCLLPSDTVAFGAARADADEDVREVARMVQDGPPFAFTIQGRSHFLYRLAKAEQVPTSFFLPTSVLVYGPGDLLALPSHDDFTPDRYKIKSLDDLHRLRESDFRALQSPRPMAEVHDNPLARYSLRGRAAEFEEKAIKAEPLLADLCMSGQSTAWYAPPNAGKTLISIKLLIDAVSEGRIDPGNVYYVNADDTSEGFAEKIGLMDDIGAHTLSPGQAGFKAESFVPLLQKAAEEGKARGTLVIVDTLKKFAALMQKHKVTVFTEAIREFVMAGGGVLGFAHTNKNASAEGKLRYAGTSDVLDDFDAAYIITPLEGTNAKREKLVKFSSLKRRGDNAESAAYAYANEPGISYAERLASVHAVNPDEFDAFQRVEEQMADSAVLNIIYACIVDGINVKMALAKEAAKRANISERSAIRLIEQYTGTDAAMYRWNFTRGPRGAKIYSVL